MAPKKKFRFRVFELCPEAPPWARVKVCSFLHEDKKGKEFYIDTTQAVSEKKAVANGYYHSDHKGTSYDTLFNRDGIKLVAAFVGGKLDKYLLRLKERRGGDSFPTSGFWGIVEGLAKSDRHHFMTPKPSQPDLFDSTPYRLRR